jgi:hypothetical protein
MSSTYEQYTIQEIKAINAGFINQLREGQESQEKAASAIKEELILTILREDGVSRRLIPLRPTSNAELTPDAANPDVPAMMVPVEPVMNEYLATNVDFMQPSKEVWFRSNVAFIYFKVIKSKTVTLTEMQLLANNFPIRSYIESVAKNDILVVEDMSLMDAIERSVAKFPGTNVLSSAGPLTKDTIAEGKKAMTRNRLDLDLIVLNEITYADILKWNSSEVGSIIEADIIEHGPKGQQGNYRSWLGYKWVTTINEDVIPENVIYYLPPQRYLGNGYILSEAEQFLEFREGILRTNTREIIARGILNPRGPIKHNLT